MAGQNLISPDDEEAMFRSVEREVARIKKDMGDVEKSSEGVKKNFTDAANAMGGNRPGGGKLGLGTMPFRSALGQFSNKELAVGGAMVAGSIGMSMAPNTMSAVAQRMYADSVAGLSGMKASQVIGQSNRLVQGATSAGGPTAAAANLFYQGGYSAGSLSSKSIMSSLGGLSAMTGGTNEQVASSLAGINGMGFLRAGVRIRDNQGNLLPINQIVNSVYNMLYGGRSITPEQAAMLLNPNSKGYQTLMIVCGGDTNLMQTISMAVIARAKKGSALSKKDLGSSNQALNIMGVEGNSPIRSNFNFAKGENMALASTQAGLVNGYNVSLNTVGGLNRAFADLASAVAPVTYGLMSLKGTLQTFPQAGNMGGTLSGIGSMATGFAGQAMNAAIMGRVMGVGKFAAGGSTAESMAAGQSRLAALRGSTGLKLGGTALIATLLQAGLNATYGNKHQGSNIVKYGNMAASMGTGAASGAAIGTMIAPGIGTGIGAVLGTGLGLIQSLMAGGQGGSSDGSGGNGNTGSPSGSSQGLALAVPAGTAISSPYGNRKGGEGVKPGFHHGIDYKTPVGTNITAMADGIVSYVGNDKAGYGNYVTIDHGAVSTRYAHLSKVLVRKGQRVKRGEVIGKSGGKKGAAGAGNSTGPHLHNEVLQNGKAVNPASFFGKAGNFLTNLFKDGINMAKNAVGWLTGGNTKNPVTNPFRNVQNSKPGVDPSGLSSASLSSILNGDLNHGRSVGYKDIEKWLNSHPSKSMNLNGDATSVINNAYNAGKDESPGRMAGGSRAGMMRILQQAGFKGKALETAFAVALAESGGRMDRPGDLNLQSKKWGPSIGMFQIRSLKDWKSYNNPNRDASRLSDANYNAQAAYNISHGGTNWKPWSTYNSGAFLKYIDDAQRTESGMGGSSGMSSLSTNPARDAHPNKNVHIKLDMHVNIAKSGVAEAEQMFRHLEKKLEHALRKHEVTLY
jgi:hypothetical protein